MNFNPLKSYIQSLLDKGVPGLELIVCQEHQILFHACAGYSDPERVQAATPTDRYWLYSCTKPVTAAAAMRAMEQGLFDLDDPVSDYLPAYRDVYLLKEGLRQKPANTMRIRHLMTMTAGFDYNLECESIRHIQASTGNHASTIQIAEALAQEPLCFEPGERFQYSLCLDVLGAVIERASGMTLRDYMKEQLFLPLDMTDTDFCTEGIPERLAAKYTYDTQNKKVLFTGYENTFVISPTFFGGGAGLVSTATDYSKFADALACGGIGQNGKRILKPESIDLMRHEQLSAFQVNGTFSCTCGSDYGYGLGVRTRIAFEHGQKSAIGEFGWDGAAGADLLVDPEHRLSMVYMQHVHNWPSLLGPVHLELRDVLYPLLKDLSNHI